MEEDAAVLLAEVAEVPEAADQAPWSRAPCAGQSLIYDYGEDVGPTGRRSRTKAQQQGATKGVVKAQQLARVNVSLEAWQEFRVMALRGGTTVADYLGELVKKELQRPAPRATEAPASTDVRDTGQLAAAGRKGGQKAREIAERWRETRRPD